MCLFFLGLATTKKHGQRKLLLFGSFGSGS